MSERTSSKIVRNVCTVMLIGLMTLCAEITDIKEFIFPEIGALCIGLWVVNKHVWRVQKVQIPVLFTLAAFIGVAIVRYMPCSLPVQMETGFFLIAMLLMLSCTSITPVISACMLPILMGTDQWLYVAVVFVSTTILSVGQYIMERNNIRDYPNENISFSISPSRLRILLRWFALMLILAPVMFLSAHYGKKFVMVPPLIVTLVEFSNSASGFRKRPFSTWAMIMVCALIGTFTEGIMHQMWNVPQTICALLSTLVILIFFDRLGKYFAPAMAISLVPMIIPDAEVLRFPLYIAIGAAYFIFMAEVCFGSKSRETFKSVTHLSND